jgi:hypothetical protein
MNPLEWRRELQLAGIVCCVIGAIIGLLFAWFQSPFYSLSQRSLSGEWANSSKVFVLWLPHLQLYWPWPLAGAFLAGLAFYMARLIRS